MEFRGGIETFSTASQSPSHSAFGRDLAASPSLSESPMHCSSFEDQESSGSNTVELEEFHKTLSPGYEKILEAVA